MKVALLLSGLARNVKEGYDSFFKNVIEDYKADVYLHYWKDGEWDEVLKVYSPKKYLCVEPFPFTEYKKGVQSPNDKLARPIYPYDVAGNFTALPMFWGWQSVYSLIEDDYDCIIKSRFDLACDERLDVSKYDLNKINLSEAWPGTDIADDNLCITSKKLADLIYNDCFDRFVENIKNDGIIYFPEKNFTEMLIRKGLHKHITKNKTLNFRLLREFIVWY